ncbi:hypothetical protein [Shimia ponticola]|uniref:hypothetical protein n=1 Tax=Shimia ponticola TaxID=2582893 RepID=UPI0011BEC578|nr:hypothetical protein [Shimia ponticola]
MPLFVWFIVIFAACSGLWNLFAMSGILLMEPTETVGQVTSSETNWVQIRAGVSAGLFFTLAWGAWRRHPIAVWAVAGLIVVSLIGWAHVPTLVSSLPNMPGAMMTIWFVYRASALLVLFAIAAYLIRLYRKDRLA